MKTRTKRLERELAASSKLQHELANEIYKQTAARREAIRLEAERQAQCAR